MCQWIAVLLWCFLFYPRRKNNSEQNMDTWFKCVSGGCPIYFTGLYYKLNGMVVKVSYVSLEDHKEKTCRPIQDICRFNGGYLIYYTYIIYSKSCISWLFLDIAPWLHVFKAEDAVDFSQLTFDPGQKELIAGARWEIYFIFCIAPDWILFFVDKWYLAKFQYQCALVWLPCLLDPLNWMLRIFISLIPDWSYKMPWCLPDIKVYNGLHFSNFQEDCPGVHNLYVHTVEQAGVLWQCYKFTIAWSLGWFQVWLHNMFFCVGMFLIIIHCNVRSDRFKDCRIGGKVGDSHCLHSRRALCKLWSAVTLSWMSTLKQWQSLSTIFFFLLAYEA